MTDVVEVKVTCESELVPAAGELLALGPGTSGEVWFYEDLSPGFLPELPLLEAGVVVRTRRNADGSDVTVKLRPCRWSQLVANGRTTARAYGSSRTGRGSGTCSRRRRSTRTRLRRTGRHE